MKIEWNKVTKISQIVAIVLFVGIFLVGFQIGRTFENKSVLGAPIISAKFTCIDNKIIDADFYKNFVHLKLSLNNKAVYLPQTISASGARYANDDESVVFWNKGNTAFITEGDPNNPTYKDCMAPIPKNE